MKCRKLLEKVQDTLLDVFFPRFCFSCGVEGKYLCEYCTLYLSETELSCVVCGESEFYGKIHKRCKKRSSLDGFVGFWEYEGVAKKLIQETKYNSFKHTPKELVEYGFYSIKENEARFSEFLSFLYKKETVITFVPISRNKYIKRGFNQAEEIALQVGKITKKEVVSMLKKTRETGSQTALTKKEREKNVKNTFTFKDKTKKHKEVILVDDVLTSGATLEECAKTLKKGDVKKVWGFSVCRVG